MWQEWVELGGRGGATYITSRVRSFLQKFEGGYRVQPKPWEKVLARDGVLEMAVDDGSIADGAAEGDEASTALPQAAACGAVSVLVNLSTAAAGGVHLKLELHAGVAVAALDARLDVLRAPTPSGWAYISYTAERVYSPWQVDVVSSFNHVRGKRLT